MFRILNTFNQLKLSQEVFSSLNHNLQVVRWRRKPRWVPQAKSKIFRVPEKPVIPKDEEDEIKRLYNNYRTHMKSIRRFLTYKYSVMMHQVDDTQQKEAEFLEDFTRCNEINDKWNEELRIHREARYKQDLENEINIAKERIVERRKINEQKLQDAEEIVRTQKKLAATFITPDNIDEAIEKAINSEVDYNFAIDLDGNKILGRQTIPPNKDEEKIKIKQ